MSSHGKIPRKLKYSHQVELMDIKIDFFMIRIDANNNSFYR